VNRRLLLLTGPLFTVVFFVATLFIADDGPGVKASGEKVVEFANDHEGQLFFDAFAGPALAALVIVFFSTLLAVARERYPASGAGPTVMVGGAVLWSAGMLLGSTLELAMADAADKDLDQVAQTLNVILESSWIPFIAGIAVTLIGAGMTVLRTGLVARWLGWVALVVGIVALAGPGGFLGFFVGPLWMLVAGIMLYAQTDEPESLGAGAADV
jgi:hypothetical protein